MMSKREALEYFIIASLMAIGKGEGYAAYQQCKDFLSPEMFANRQLRWVYATVCEMYEAGWACTSANDIADYIIDGERVPVEKVGPVCCFLVEVYLQFCGMTRPVTGVKWTVGEAVGELLREYDYGREVSDRRMAEKIYKSGKK